jgi:uncharacterized membrane protein
MRGVDVLLAASLISLMSCHSAADGAASLPCEVQAVLSEVCDVCHSSPPQNGAPIPLVTYADTQAPFTALPTYDHVPTWRVMGDAVQSGLMPAPWPGVMLSADQEQTLLSWVDAGAPPIASGVECR